MPKTHTFEFDDEVLNFCKGVTGVVEATDCERNFLWRENAVEAEGLATYAKSIKGSFPRVRWTNRGMMLSREIGKIGRRPIWIQFSYAQIRGQNILFWTLTSGLADHTMANKYLDALFKKLDVTIYVHRTDASNFHNAFH